MSRYIQLDDAVKVFGDVHPLDHNTRAYLENIKSLPTIEVVERKRGKWIQRKGRGCWYCSYCNTDDYYAYFWNCETGEYELQDHYCPNCGAQMDERSEDAEIHQG